MNVDPAPRPPVVDAAVSRREDMRRALATHVLAEVFRLLRRVGLSQRTIATMTGLSPSEVYEIMHGRQVMAYDVLCRIGDGLGVPRGWFGLAYDLDTAALITAADRCEPVTALADVAGWTSFDVGLRQAVRAHFAHALLQSRTGRDASLVANVLYRAGRLHLHDGMAAEAPARAVLAQLLTARDTDMARSRMFDFTALATVCLRDGDIDSGVRLDWKAIIMADELRSARATDRLRPLADAVRAKAELSSDAAHRCAD